MSLLLLFSGIPGVYPRSILEVLSALESSDASNSHRYPVIDEAANGLDVSDRSNYYVMPVYQGTGTQVGGTTGTLTVVWPSHVANDEGFLLVETNPGDDPVFVNAQGFVQVGFSNGGTAGTVGSRLSVYWKIAGSASEASPTIDMTTTGNHVVAQIVTVRGARNITPVLYAFDNPASASSSGTISSVTTRINDSLILMLLATGNDSAAAFVTSITNAALTSITERADGGNTSGNGGGLAAYSAYKAGAGSTGTSSVSYVTATGFKPTAIIVVEPMMGEQVHVEAASSADTPSSSVSATVAASDTLTAAEVVDAYVTSGNVDQTDNASAADTPSASGTSTVTRSESDSATDTSNASTSWAQTETASAIDTSDRSNLSSVIADANDGEVVGSPDATLLLHFDGVNAAVTTIDEVKAIVPTFVGAARLGSAQKKFGNTSLDLTGNGMTGPFVNPARCIEFPASADYNPGVYSSGTAAGDWTLELWYYQTSYGGWSGAGRVSNNSHLVSRVSEPHLSSEWKLLLNDQNFDQTSAYPSFIAFDGSGNSFQLSGPSSLNLNQWYHVAVSRKGDTWRLFIDGTQIAASSNFQSRNINLSGATSTLKIGNTYVGGGGDDQFMGYIDEVRITKGRAIYASAFTPPAVPFTLMQAVSDAALGYNVVESEAGSATEASDRSMAASTTITESASAANSQTGTAASTVTITESGAAADTTNGIVAGSIVSIIEAASALDSSSKGVAQAQAEPAAASETEASSMVASVARVEAASAADTSAKELVNLAQETLSATDASNRVMSSTATESETGNATATESMTPTLSRVVYEPIPGGLKPEDVPGCLVYLDGRDLAGNTPGNTFSTGWADRSANGNDAVSLGGDPTYNEGVSYYGGIIRYVTVTPSNAMVTPPLGISGNAPRSVYALVRLSAYGTFLGMGDASGTGTALDLWNRSTGVYAELNFSGHGVDNLGVGSPLLYPGEGWIIVQCYHDGVELRTVKATAYGNPLTITLATTNTGIVLGFGSDLPASTVDIAAVAVYDRVHDFSTQYNIVQALAASIALNGPPDLGLVDTSNRTMTAAATGQESNTAVDTKASNISATATIANPASAISTESQVMLAGVIVTEPRTLIDSSNRTMVANVTESEVAAATEVPSVSLSALAAAIDAAVAGDTSTLSMLAAVAASEVAALAHTQASAMVATSSVIEAALAIENVSVLAQMMASHSSGGTATDFAAAALAAIGFVSDNYPLTDLTDAVKTAYGTVVEAGNATETIVVILPVTQSESAHATDVVKAMVFKSGRMFLIF